MDGAPKPVTALHKLATRLQSTSPTIVKLHRQRRPAAHRTTANLATRDPDESLREQLRARLLRMILENERVRRNETRANAS